MNSDWRLDPREAFTNIFDPQGTPRGIGNQVSAEFNFIYRWHSATSNEDEKWANGLMSQVIGKDVDVSKCDAYPDRHHFAMQEYGLISAGSMSVDDFRTGFASWISKNINTNEPNTWVFDNLKRQSDGSFADKDLMKLLKEATDNVAGAFGARNVPPALKVIEMLGIQQGRDWGMASLNEFRSFYKLKPFTSFSEINSDESVATACELKAFPPCHQLAYIPSDLCILRSGNAVRSP